MTSSATRSIRINAAPETVFDVIVDYSRYCEFLPEITSAEIIAEYPDATVVRFELDLIMRMTYVLRMTSVRPERISWQLESSNLFVANFGEWLLQAEDGGTKATYAINIRTRAPVPKAVTQRLMADVLPKTLRHFKDRVEGG